jgi:hypothetical protein
MIIFWFGTTHTAEATGCISRVCRCEKCRVEFGYVVRASRSASVTNHYGGSSPAKQAEAEDWARYEMAERLNSYPGEVPCPNCGWYQAVMLPWVRLRLYRWVTIAIVLCLFAVPLSWLSSAIIVHQVVGRQTFGTIDVVATALISTAFLLTAIGLHFGRRYLRGRYDPNRVIPDGQRRDLGLDSAQILRTPMLNAVVPDGTPILAPIPAIPLKESRFARE